MLPSRSEQKECGKKPFGTDSCLVCWDAPLSGLQQPDALTTNETPSTESLTTRTIERTGDKSLDKYRRIANAARKTGVSVRGFSGLSHWVISRNVLGLPRVGRFDARVAWLLGHLWLHGDAVELVGNRQDGTFLLPRGDTTSN
jgi:hypothetical protein